MATLDVDQLYRRYGHILFRRCRSLLRRDEDAMDAVQDVFAKVLKYSSKLDPMRSPLPWLLQIANRVCFDHYTKNRRDPVLDNRGDVQMGVEGVRSEQKADLMEILSEFDQQMQDIVVAYHVEEMTMEEISADIGLSRKTVGKRIEQFQQSLERVVKERTAS